MVSTANRFISTSSYLVVFIVIAVLVIGPLVTGVIIRDHYQSYLDKLSAHLNLQLRIADYSQGWFSSEVRLTVTGIYFDGEYSLYDHLVHGPVYLGLLNQGRFPLAMAVIEGELRSGQSGILDDLFAHKIPVLYQAVLEHNGNYDVNAHVPAIVSSSSIAGNPFEVVSSAVRFSLKHIKDGGKYTAEGTWPELSINSYEQSIRVDGFRIAYDSGRKLQNENSNATLDTDVVVVFDEYDLVTKNRQTVIRDFGFRHLGSNENGRMESEDTITIRQVLTNNEKLGPIEMKIRAENLHAVALSNVLRVARASLQRITRGIPMYQVQLIANKKLQNNIGPLFSESTIVADPINIKSESGDISITVAYTQEKMPARADNQNTREPTVIPAGHKLDVRINMDHHAYELLTGLFRVNNSNDESGANTDASAQLLSRLLTERIFLDDGEAYRFRYHEDSEGVIINRGAAGQGQLSDILEQFQ